MGFGTEIAYHMVGLLNWLLSDAQTAVLYYLVAVCIAVLSMCLVFIVMDALRPLIVNVIAWIHRRMLNAGLTILFVVLSLAVGVLILYALALNRHEVEATVADRGASLSVTSVLEWLRMAASMTWYTARFYGQYAWYGDKVFNGTLSSVDL